LSPGDAQTARGLGRFAPNPLAAFAELGKLAPPGVETTLFRGEFAEETKNMKAMDVKVLVKKAIAGIESGHDEIRPGQSNLLELMSRLAPEFALKMLSMSTKSK
jgi:short-subunit dehydrogenase